MTDFRTLDQVDVRGKRVLLRVGRVGDRTRIERVMPTIKELADKGGKVILLSHLGRPKGAPQERPAHPVVAIVGGAKVSSKLDLLGNLLNKVDILY
jgi:phosphoglycerate kinase